MGFAELGRCTSQEGTAGGNVMSAHTTSSGEHRQASGVEIPSLRPQAPKPPLTTNQDLPGSTSPSVRGLPGEYLSTGTERGVPPERERRQTQRTAGLRLPVEVCLIGTRLGRVRTYLCNLSDGGLGIVMPAPVAAGALLAVWPD